MATFRAKTIRRKPSPPSERRRRSLSAEEVAGSTTAGFAAIACCAPYGVANLVMLAVYKVPAGICRKALRDHRRRRLLKSGMEPLLSRSAGGAEMAELYASQAAFRWSEEDAAEVGIVTDGEFRDLEEAMWDHFASTGFWRSASRRERD